MIVPGSLFAMYGRPDTPESTSPWLVRAEVTIRHGTEPGISPASHDAAPEPAGGLRMVYKWSQDPRSNSGTPQRPAESPAAAPAGSYAFQRGNILFTSTPPPRNTAFTGSPTFVAPQSLGINVSDSGYNSEQFSPQSYGSLPLRRPFQQYNRRCKSTCSIVLSAAGIPASEERLSESVATTQTHCGDRWCYHRGNLAAAVPEACEDCLEGITSGRKAFTSHFCTRVPGKNPPSKSSPVNSKDAASQTTDVEPQSPLSSLSGEQPPLNSATSIKAYDSRRKTAPGLLRRFHARETKAEEVCRPSCTIDSKSVNVLHYEFIFFEN